MNKTELEEAIKNGESVWFVDNCNEKVWEIDLNEKYKPEIYLDQILYVYQNTNDRFKLELFIKNIFKTKAEAEHYLHHANVTRTKQLPFLTWEEFDIGGCQCEDPHVSNDNINRLNGCPLIDIKTHDRELVKEVCEKIIHSAYNVLYKEGNFDISDLECVVQDIKDEFRFGWTNKQDPKWQKLKEVCWVIQRDNGEYFAFSELNYDGIPQGIFFTKYIHLAYLEEKELLEHYIKRLDLQNCHPVKVEIRVIGE